MEHWKSNRTPFLRRDKWLHPENTCESDDRVSYFKSALQSTKATYIEDVLVKSEETPRDELLRFGASSPYNYSEFYKTQKSGLGNRILFSS